MRSVLVTGGAGFIGGNFVHWWRRHHPADRVVVLDALTYAGNLATIQDAIDVGVMKFVHGDIRDAALVSRVFAEHDIDTVVHFAAESHVDRSIEAPMRFVETNVLGTLVLLEAAASAWRSDGTAWRENVRFHHVSTDEVYGSLGALDAPFTESSPYQPNSPYAASKAAADHLVRAFMHTYGLPATISNCGNNYGPYQYPEKLIPLMIVNALLGRPLPVYGDGLQVRDWLHVDDHCAAIDAILHTASSGSVFNIGARAEQVNRDIVTRICNAIDGFFAERPTLAALFPNCPAARGAHCRELIAHVTDRPGHDRRYALDATHLETTLGFRARQSFDAGLRQTIAWYIDNGRWWQPLIQHSSVM